VHFQAPHPRGDQTYLQGRNERRKKPVTPVRKTGRGNHRTLHGKGRLGCSAMSWRLRKEKKNRDEGDNRSRCTPHDQKGARKLPSSDPGLAAGKKTLSARASETLRGKSDSRRSKGTKERTEPLPLLISPYVHHSTWRQAMSQLRVIGIFNPPKKGGIKES